MYRLKVRNEGESSQYDLYLYSKIEGDDSPFGISAKSVVDELSQAEFSKLTLHINSEGGDLFEALTIYNYLQELKAKGVSIEATIEGMCASSASVIAMIADKITMSQSASFMIHKPMAEAFGNDEKLSEYVALLQDLNSKLVNIYSARTGLSDSTIIDIMNKAAYLNADSCKTFGFVDEIAPVEAPVKIQNSARLDIDPVFKPVDKSELAISNMAEIINRSRGYGKA